MQNDLKRVSNLSSHSQVESFQSNNSQEPHTPPQRKKFLKRHAVWLTMWDPYWSPEGYTRWWQCRVVGKISGVLSGWNTDVTQPVGCIKEQGAKSRPWRWMQWYRVLKKSLNKIHLKVLRIMRCLLSIFPNKETDTVHIQVRLITTRLVRALY